jgi:hypothetical protein
LFFVIRYNAGRLAVENNKDFFFWVYVRGVRTAARAEY